MMKGLNKAAIFLCAILFTSFFIGNAQKKSKMESSVKRPNIILLMADDQGWGDVHYNGHPYIKTPNLDQMVKDGIRFTRFYAASAVCSPTRASVMTGRNPERFGVCFANCGHLKKQEISLAELVKMKGYISGHFGKWHLGTLTKTVIDANRGGRPDQIKNYSPPWENGFDVTFATESKVPTWNPMITPPKSAGDIGKRKPGTPFGTKYWVGEGKIVAKDLNGDDSRIIMDRVIPFIDNAEKERKPFLCVVWFHTPHLPVLTGEQYKKEYKNLSEDQQNFYGAITAMDAQIGRLRKRLKELNIDKNTIIFYCSDNGPEGKTVSGRTQGLTHGLSERKRSLKEGGIHVPGIMVWPGKVPAGMVVNYPVYTSDYFPTIATLLNIDIAKFHRPYDGINIMPIIKNQERHIDQSVRYLPFYLRGQAALIGIRYKIYRESPKRDWQLFDLLADPDELTDISNEHPGIVEEMSEIWQTRYTSVLNSAKGNDY